MIYAGSQDGNLYALNATGGSLAWKYKTNGQISGGPIVDNGIVYTGSGDGNVYAVDTPTGFSCWVFSADSPVNSTPAIGNGHIYFYSSGGNKNGSTLYSLILPEKLEIISPTPTPYPAGTDINTTIASPTIPPSANTASSWCPIPWLMAALVAGIGLIVSARRQY